MGSGTFREGGQALWLFLCLECCLPDNCGRTCVLHPCPVPGFSCSLYCSLLQECSLNLFAAPAEGSASHTLIPAPSGPSPTVSSRLQGCVHSSSRPSPFFTSTVSFHLPTFRGLNAWITQTCFCVEQGLFCPITAVQTVEISRGETRGISHAAIPLMSLSKIF